MEAMPRRKHREVIEDLLELDGARVADIGCGDGALAKASAIVSPVILASSRAKRSTPRLQARVVDLAVAV
jgi:predicted RNA methylase